MPLFAYEAVTDAGERTMGRARAGSEAALLHDLASRGLHALDVRLAPAPREWQPGRARREVLEVVRALAALLSAGVPLTRALGIAQDVATGRVRDAIDDIRLRVERGERLAAALAAHATLFPASDVGLVHAGERRGDLARAFTRLATQRERAEALRGRLLAALLYPALLAVAGAIAVGLLLLVVLPRFTTLLADAGAALPASTRGLLAASALLAKLWPLLVLAVVGAVAASLWMRNDPRGRRAGARLLLALPFGGGMRRQVLSARIARLLAALLDGGAPLSGALGDVQTSLGDPFAQEATARVRGAVRTGSSLAAALRAEPLIAPLLPQLVAIGEASAALPTFLDKAADLLDERTERAAQRLATLAEPTLIVVLGGVVALIAFALLQAIYGIDAGALSA